MVHQNRILCDLNADLEERMKELENESEDQRRTIEDLRLDNIHLNETNEHLNKCLDEIEENARTEDCILDILKQEESVNMSFETGSGHTLSLKPKNPALSKPAKTPKRANRIPRTPASHRVPKSTQRPPINSPESID
jgi:regulator of replication initiation timing